jgi:flagellar biosynthesis protein FlhF
MRLRRFEATTVAEALAQVREDLGPDAVILHARTTTAPPERGSLVEVTAAVDEERPAPPPRTAPGRARRAQAAAVATAIGADAGIFPGFGRAGDGLPPRALEDIHQLLSQLRAEMEPAPKIPAALRPLYRHLVAQDLPTRTARRLVLGLPPGVRTGRKPADLAALQETLAQSIRVSGPLTLGGGRKVVALVGPTGVGKTTTIAKLAGQFHHVAGLRVALISLDTYRIGALAQMRIYADLLGAPLHVVRTAAEIEQVLAAEAEADLVLVDTTGRSPRHADGIAATRAVLSRVADLEAHLVVSATTKHTDLEETLRHFRPLRYQRVLVTKLDEARSLGPIVHAALEHQLTISYLATGQEVPDDLEAATPWRLAASLIPGKPGHRRRPVAHC